MILAVTGFIPIPGHPRREEEYEQLGEQLFEANIPLLRLNGDLEHCWLWRYLKEQGKDFTHSTADNPEKNTLAYHCVQAEKSELLALAADIAPWPKPDVLVWIDLGIFHLPGVTGQIVRDFMQRAENEYAIAIPGCWDNSYEYNDQYPCWRYCGGLMVVPFKYVDRFDAIMKGEYKRWLEQTGNVSWEVNTLARIEQQGINLPLWWYKADHNASMFTNYKATELADV